MTVSCMGFVKDVKIERVKEAGLSLSLLWWQWTNFSTPPPATFRKFSWRGSVWMCDCAGALCHACTASLLFHAYGPPIHFVSHLQRITSEVGCRMGGRERKGMAEQFMQPHGHCPPPLLLQQRGKGSTCCNEVRQQQEKEKEWTKKLVNRLCDSAARSGVETSMFSSLRNQVGWNEQGDGGQIDFSDTSKRACLVLSIC